MSWFSRIRVDLAGLPHDEIQRLIAGDAYLHHALVWRAFAKVDTRRDFVFRIDQGEQGLPQYYVVSQRPPQVLPGLLIDTKPFAPKLAEGDEIAFVLRANPTVARAQGPGRRSVRDDVMMSVKHRLREQLPPAQLVEEMQQAARDWLLARADTLGLDIGGLEVLADRQQHLRHKGRHIRFTEVDYQGVAQVTDPARLLEALQGGIGRARGFGCGLLLIRRLA